MLDGLESLHNNDALCQLLERYRECRDEKPEAEWYDRVMHLEMFEQADLTDLHGEALAEGWLDARVAHDTFAQPGPPRQCYRLTQAGLRLLRQLDDGLGHPTSSNASVW